MRRARQVGACVCAAARWHGRKERAGDGIGENVETSRKRQAAPNGHTGESARAAGPGKGTALKREPMNSRTYSPCGTWMKDEGLPRSTAARRNADRLTPSNSGMTPLCCIMDGIEEHFDESCGLTRTHRALPRVVLASASPR